MTFLLFVDNDNRINIILGPCLCTLKYIRQVGDELIFSIYFIFNMSSYRKPEIQNDLPKLAKIK